MKKIISVILALTVFVCSFSALSAQAASWRTGCVNGRSNSGYTTVYLSNTKKNAKIKVHSYTYLINPNNAKEKSTSFHVTMRTTGNKWIWEGDITTGSKGKEMKLGNDHSAYKICFRQNDIPFGSYTLNYANYWGIQCTSNCYV